jgi:hypothetical protein
VCDLFVATVCELLFLEWRVDVVPSVLTSHPPVTRQDIISHTGCSYLGGALCCAYRMLRAWVLSILHLISVHLHTTTFSHFTFMRVHMSLHLFGFGMYLTCCCL